MQDRQDAIKLSARTYFTGNPCINGHVAPRTTSEGKCCVCLWLSWEKVRRKQGAKPFQPNMARRIAQQAGERYFNGRPCARGHSGLRWTHNSGCVECSTKAARDFHSSEEGKAYTRLWRAANSDAVGEHNRNQKAKRRGAAGRHTAEDIRNILGKQKYKCAECKASVRLKAKRQVDHIIPIARGGTNWPSNLQILCAPCNMSKGAKHPIDFARSKGRLL